MPWRSPPWDQVVYWAIDLETTGLDPRRDLILEVAMVPMRAGSICWGERFHALVQPPPQRAAIGEGVRAHHILPGELRDAMPFPRALREIDARLSQGVLLAHFATVDVQFLRRAYAAAGLRWPRPPIVDTARLLRALDRRRLTLDATAQPLPTGLPRAREALGLPPYHNHRAASDALATAELLLVLRARLGARRLRQLTI
jgi:DNA polymerase-3 subunit epsilon